MVSDDLNVEPRLTKPGSICYLDEKKLCLFAIFTLTRDEFHELTLGMNHLVQCRVTRVW